MILVGSHDKVEDGEEIDLVTKNAMMVMAMLKKIMIVRLGDGPATPSKFDRDGDGEEIELGMMMMTLVIALVLIMIMIIMMMMMMIIMTMMLMIIMMMVMMIQTW